MTYSEMIEERDGYRVRLVLAEYADPPYDCSGSPILRIDNHGYGRGNPVFVDTSEMRPHQEDDYIINAVNHWQTDPSDQDWPLFEKYLRAFFGVRDIEYYRSPDYWYVTYDSEGWRDSLGLTDEESAPPNMEEYKAWCEGDVYYYVVEKRVHWTTEDETIVNRETDTWETVDSCGGFYGDYAREAALEAFVAEGGGEDLMGYIGKGHTPGKCLCGHYHPANQVDAIAKAANEMADLIQLLDLSHAEYQDWQVIMGAMGPATYNRRMDDF